MVKGHVTGGVLEALPGSLEKNRKVMGSDISNEDALHASFLSCIVSFPVIVVVYHIILCRSRCASYRFRFGIVPMQGDAVNQLPASRRRLQAHRTLIKSGSGQVESSRVGRRKCARPSVKSAPYPGPDAAQDQLDGQVKFPDLLEDVDHHDYELEDTEYELGDSDHHETQTAGHPLNVPPSHKPNAFPPNEPNTPPPDEPNTPPPNELNTPPPDKPNTPPPDKPQHLPQPLHHVFNIDQLEEEAVLLKQTDAVAFIKLLWVASLDDPVAKLDDATLNRLHNRMMPR
ncbi:hypothetical protein DFH29DRAFT_880367 [Suillus ampliporus]|nr:hypothetical protein DFH29DRAFT_880367 [Suillus ampliporus]